MEAQGGRGSWPNPAPPALRSREQPPLLGRSLGLFSTNFSRCGVGTQQGPAEAPCTRSTDRGSRPRVERGCREGTFLEASANAKQLSFAKKEKEASCFYSTLLPTPGKVFGEHKTILRGQSAGGGRGLPEGHGPHAPPGCKGEPLSAHSNAHKGSLA